MQKIEFLQKPMGSERIDIDSFLLYRGTGGRRNQSAFAFSPVDECTFAVEKCRRLMGYVGILHDMWLVNNEHTGLTVPSGLLSFSLHHSTQCLPIRRYVVVHCHGSVCSLLSSAVPC